MGTPVRALVAAALLAACSDSAPGQTAIVVGVASEQLQGAIGSLQVTTTVAGKPSSATIALSDLPYQKTVVAPANGSSAPLAVQVLGYPGPPGSGGAAPLLVRTAETQFLPGETRLLRIDLEASCLLPLPGGPPGAPACTAPQTCVGGACASDLVAPASLAPYTQGWAATMPDICKPENAGPPVVQVGTGQTDYLPLTQDQTVVMEAGPQGGHHIWIAVRQQNLAQKGTTTTLTSVQPDTAVVGPRMSFVFDFDPDEGNFCKLYGLRYQVDIDGADYHTFLGKPLDVTVTLKDPSGETAAGHALVNISPTLLCPGTASSCN